MARLTPYTELGIKRLKCFRCDNKASQQWQICADDNIYRPICAQCDIELNVLVMDFMKVPDIDDKIQQYKKSLALPTDLGKFTKRWECDVAGDVCETHTFRWINEKAKMIWWEVPRCGSSQLASRTFDRKKWERVTMDQVDNISYKDYFNFAVVGNPWRRVASCFWLYNSYQRRMGEGKHLSANVPFPQFVDDMFKEGHRNHHWAPVSMYTPPEDAPFDFTIIPLENLTEEWNKIAKEHDQPLMVPLKERHAAHNPNPWREIYDKHTGVYDVVRAHYHEDIRRFGHLFS